MKAEIIMIFLFSIIFLSCNSESKISEKPQEKKVESVNEGKLTIYADSSIINILKPTFDFYHQSYPKIELNAQFVNSRRAVALLFSGEAEAIVIARNYLKDEDSLNKEYQLNRPEMIIAKDALVFFTTPDFPLDTLNAELIFKILTDNKKFKDFFPNLTFEPELVISNNNNSEYAGLQQLVSKNSIIKKSLKFLSNSQEVRNYIKKNKNSIGIGFLSNVVTNPDFKSLRVGFINKDGKRIPPQIVHQGFIVQEKYPYIVEYKAILREDRRNKPFWFASYLSKETKVQKYFMDSGLVPGYAKIVLVPNENSVK